MTQSEDGGWVKWGMLELGEAKRIRSLLEDRGVRLRLQADPESCGTKNCKPQVEVSFAEKDQEAFLAFLEEERARHYAGLEIDPELLGEVFDSEQSHATCPACGTRFATQCSECPECGLGFGSL